MMFTTCFWTLLSQKDLSFVYLSPWLSKSLGSEHDLLLGTSFFDYFHPEEQELARHDLSELVKKKTLTYSVTRCQYNTIQTIRRKLQQSIISSSKSSSQQMPSQYSPVSSTMTSPNFTSTVPQEIQQSNDEYIVMDVGMNVVSQEFVLACFHSDDVKQSNSNCVSSKCGETEFTKEEVNKLTSFMRKHGFSKVQTPPSTPFPEIIVNNETPNRIFQILDKKSRNLIFSWPDTNDHISNVSYNKNDFSRLLKNVILDSNNITRNNNLVKGTDVESPNCLKLISDKHYLLTSGTYRQVESVIIPYGDIIFACFQILPSTILSVSSAFSKPKARSAPCSPSTTINNNNGIAKRPRSPGSLSPLPSPFYDDDIRRYVQNHHHSNTSHYPQEVPDFILEKRSSKRHRIDPPSVSSANDSLVPVKISYSPPNPPQLLLNPISPKASPSYLDQQQRRQFPFPPQIIKDQPPQTLQPPQQPYYPFVVPQSGPQSRQPSPKQQDYPSPKNHPSQFLSQNNNHHNHTVQPQQSPPSSQSQSSVAVAHQQRRNNNGNNNNNSNANNSNSNNNVQGAKKCESCHTSTSPEWRRGPTGHKTLCNACGLRYSRTIARENRKREQAQREQEQRQREQREREERARERAAATAMMNRGVIEPPFPQYVRTSNAIIPPGQQQQQHHHHHHHHQTSTHSPHSSGPSQQYHSSTLPPLNYHRHHQPSLPQPQTSHHHHSHHHHNVHNVHHNAAHPVPPPLNDRVGYTLPPPNFIDRQQNGVVGASNGYQIGNSVIGVGVMTDNHRRDQLQHNGEGERYTTNVMNNMPPTANAYPKEAYFGRAQ